MPASVCEGSVVHLNHFLSHHHGRPCTRCAEQQGCTRWAEQQGVRQQQHRQKRERAKRHLARRGWTLGSLRGKVQRRQLRKNGSGEGSAVSSGNAFFSMLATHALCWRARPRRVDVVRDPTCRRGAHDGAPLFVHWRRVPAWPEPAARPAAAALPAERRCAHLLPLVSWRTGRKDGRSLCTLGHWPDAVGRARVVGPGSGIGRLVQSQLAFLRGTPRQRRLREVGASAV